MLHSIFIESAFTKVTFMGRLLCKNMVGTHCFCFQLTLLGPRFYNFRENILWIKTRPFNFLKFFELWNINQKLTLYKFSGFQAHWMKMYCYLLVPKQKPGHEGAHYWAQDSAGQHIHPKVSVVYFPLLHCSA